jgi:hypothetical protein
MRTAVIAAIMFGPGYKAHPKLAPDSFFQNGSAYRAMFIKNDFFHFLFLSWAFSSAEPFAARFTEMLSGIVPGLAAHISSCGLGNLAAEPRKLSTGHRIMQS